MLLVFIPLRLVGEVVAADAETITISTRDQHRHSVVRHLEAGGHGERPPVQGVHSVGVDEAGKVRGAADSADGGYFMVGDLQFDQRLLHCGKNAKVTTTRAPVGIDLALEVGHAADFWGYCFGCH
jgi:hypothetical protein